MTNEEYFKLVDSELERIKTIIKAKNADYTGGSSDPFANFRASEGMNLADAEIGLLIRICDKIQRVNSFVKKGSLQVKDESAQDAARDIIGYALCLLGLLEERKSKPLIDVVVDPSLKDNEYMLIQANAASNGKPVNPSDVRKWYGQ